MASAAWPVGTLVWCPASPALGKTSGLRLVLTLELATCGANSGEPQVKLIPPFSTPTGVHLQTHLCLAGKLTTREKEMCLGVWS